MFWRTFGNKTVNELRKGLGLTVRELAAMVKINEHLIKKVDHFKLKNVPQPLKGRLEPVLRGKKRGPF